MQSSAQNKYIGTGGDLVFIQNRVKDGKIA